MMNEAMKTAWLEISQMLGEPTREELDVFLRTWQRATQARSAPVQELPVFGPPIGILMKMEGDETRKLYPLKQKPAPVQEPIDTLIEAWQYLDETHGHLSDTGDAEGRMHISVIRSAWEQMDSLVREMWDERGRL
jgi:hypothetical protein